MVFEITIILCLNPNLNNQKPSSTSPPVNLVLSGLMANYALVLLLLDVSGLQKDHMAFRQQKHHCANKGLFLLPKGLALPRQTAHEIVVVAAVLKITQRNTRQLARTESSYHYNVQTTDWY